MNALWMRQIAAVWSFNDWCSSSAWCGLAQ